MHGGEGLQGKEMQLNEYACVFLNSVGNVNSVRYKVICSMKDEN